MLDDPAPAALEQYLLLLLSDSNLPSGGFVASSGLESYIQHGLLSSDGASSKVDGVLRFVHKSVHAYARLQLPFLASVYTIVDRYLRPTAPTSIPSSEGVECTLREVRALDAQMDAMTLNHVARRASTAQGIAMLTLYERALAPTPSEDEDEGSTPRKALALVNELRKKARGGEMAIHLSTGFAVLTASLGLSLGAAQHLYLFLHARSVLSSAVRLNTVGPYVSHKLLLHDVRPLVDQALQACAHWRVDQLKPVNDKAKARAVSSQAQVKDESWWRAAGAGENWDDEEDDEDGGDSGTPVTTWPLGEILAARHDQLHSKIFNS